MVISADFTIYLGNELDQEVSYTPSEICGFNTGVFEQKAIAGLGCQNLLPSTQQMNKLI